MENNQTKEYTAERDCDALLNGENVSIKKGEAIVVTFLTDKKGEPESAKVKIADKEYDVTLEETSELYELIF